MGLVLYFAVSNLFRVGQQAVIFRMDGDDDGSTVKGEGTPPERPKMDGPSPNASKKRNRRRRK
jgi:membrane protein insertase Oxa1/YidC/SpoIIIJ